MSEEQYDLQFDNSEIHRYLLFSLGAEKYATPLLGIREVIEYQAPTPVANTVNYCLGVINVRGEIIGVVDLRRRLGHPDALSPSTAILVFPNKKGALAAIVDRIGDVVEIRPDQIEKKPNISLKLPVEYLIGIGRLEKQLVTVIDLGRILSEDDIRDLESTKLAG